MARYVNPDRKNPATIDDHVTGMISSMRHGGDIAKRFKAEGKPLHFNPEALPEVGVTKFAKPRERAAAKRLVETGVAVVANGSLDDPNSDVYLVAGPKFPA